jgi:hypothetical protein
MTTFVSSSEDLLNPEDRLLLVMGTTPCQVSRQKTKDVSNRYVIPIRTVPNANLYSFKLAVQATTFKDLDLSDETMWYADMEARKPVQQVLGAWLCQGWQRTSQEVEQYRAVGGGGGHVCASTGGRTIFLDTCHNEAPGLHPCDTQSAFPIYFKQACVFSFSGAPDEPGKAVPSRCLEDPYVCQPIMSSGWDTAVHLEVEVSCDVANVCTIHCEAVWGRCTALTPPIWDPFQPRTVFVSTFYMVLKQDCVITRMTLHCSEFMTELLEELSEEERKERDVVVAISLDPHAPWGSTCKMHPEYWTTFRSPGLLTHGPVELFAGRVMVPANNFIRIITNDTSVVKQYAVEMDIDPTP